MSYPVLTPWACGAVAFVCCVGGAVGDVAERTWERSVLVGGFVAVCGSAPVSCILRRVKFLSKKKNTEEWPVARAL